VCVRLLIVCIYGRVYFVALSMSMLPLAGDKERMDTLSLHMQCMGYRGV
jgi:hypothetical protein